LEISLFICILLMDFLISILTGLNDCKDFFFYTRCLFGIV